MVDKKETTLTFVLWKEEWACQYALPAFERA